LNYNDGTEIEAEKFDQTAEELCDRFGGVTEDTVRVSGTWKYGGTRYRDVLFRVGRIWRRPNRRRGGVRTMRG